MRDWKSLGLAVLALVLFGNAAPAQTTLRYQFKEGDTFRQAVAQDVRVFVNVGGKDSKLQLKLAFDMDWDIRKIDDKGSARVLLTMGRVKLATQGPDGKVEADSVTKELPPDEERDARGLAELARALAALELTFAIAPNGEVKELKIPKEVIARLRALRGLDTFGDLLSADGLKRMVGAGMVFPKEAVTSGQHWTQKTMVKLPPYGSLEGETKYTSEGPVEKDGRKLEKLVVSPNLAFKNSPESPGRVKFKGQKDQGTIFFDAEAGRIVESTNERAFEMEVEAAGMTVRLRVAQIQTLHLMPRLRPR
jgi:hypothetical protein